MLFGDYIFIYYMRDIALQYKLFNNFVTGLLNQQKNVIFISTILLLIGIFLENISRGDWAIKAKKWGMNEQAKWREASEYAPSLFITLF